MSEPDVMPRRPAPQCQESGYCEGPNAFVGVCDCYDDIWEGRRPWWKPRATLQTLANCLQRFGW